MKDPTWRNEFDKRFYFKADQGWMSRAGESYDSADPRMLRGELFRFIEDVRKGKFTP